MYFQCYRKSIAQTLWWNLEDHEITLIKSKMSICSWRTGLRLPVIYIRLQVAKITSHSKEPELYFKWSPGGEKHQVISLRGLNQTTINCWNAVNYHFNSQSRIWRRSTKTKTQTEAEVLPKVPNTNTKLTATSYGWCPYAHARDLVETQALEAASYCAKQQWWQIRETNSRLTNHHQTTATVKNPWTQAVNKETIRWKNTYFRICFPFFTYISQRPPQLAMLQWAAVELWTVTSF